MQGNSLGEKALIYEYPVGCTPLYQSLYLIKETWIMY
jgi:hypothetical protein